MPVGTLRPGNITVWNGNVWSNQNDLTTQALADLGGGQDIDDDPDLGGDTDHVKTVGGFAAGHYCEWLTTGLPSDFGSISSINFRLVTEVTGRTDDAFTFAVQLVRANGTVIGESTFITSANKAKSLQTFTPSLANTVGMTAADWADVRFRLINKTRSNSMGADAITVMLYALEVDITYIGTLSAPQNFWAIPGNARVDLSWTAPADTRNGVTSYGVRRRMNGSWDGSAQSAAGTTYSDTTVSNGQAYEYQIYAIDSDGNGTETEWIGPFYPSATTPKSTIKLTVDPTQTAPDVFINFSNYAAGVDDANRLSQLADASSDNLYADFGIPSASIQSQIAWRVNPFRFPADFNPATAVLARARLRNMNGSSGASARSAQLLRPDTTVFATVDFSAASTTFTDNFGGTSWFHDSVGNTPTIFGGVAPTTLAEWQAILLQWSTISNTSMASGYRFLGFDLWVEYTLPPPTIRQQAFGWFNDDGSLSTATAVAAVNTNVNDPILANKAYHLRLRLEETVGSPGASTDDYRLEVSTNGGVWFTLASSSSLDFPVRGFDSTHITGLEVITAARLGIGTGTWQNGKATEGPNVPDIALAGNRYTELLWVVQFLAASTNPNDTYDFRAIRLVDGVATPLSTYTVVPRFTISDGTPPSAVPVKMKGAGVFTNRPVLVKVAGVFTSRPTKTKVGGVFR